MDHDEAEATSAVTNTLSSVLAELREIKQEISALKADNEQKFSALKADNEEEFSSIRQAFRHIEASSKLQSDHLTILRTYFHANVAPADYSVEPFPVGPTGTQMIQPRPRYRRVPFWNR